MINVDVSFYYTEIGKLLSYQDLQYSWIVFSWNIYIHVSEFYARKVLWIIYKENF